MNKTILLSILMSLIVSACDSKPPTSPTEKAPEKMTLRLINGAEAATLDPTFREGSPGTSILVNLFEGLVRVDPKGGTPLPGVAKSWQISEDQQTYTFFLREDARWSNGEPVTAGDFLYSFQRAVDPKHAKRTISLFYKILNAEKVYLNKKPLSELGVEVVDPYTLKIHLEHPASYFLDMLTLVPFYPVYQEAIEKHGLSWTKAENIVSNGPFILKKRILNDKTIAEKNPFYWAAKQVKLDRIVFLTSDDTNTNLRLFLSGAVDYHTRGIAPSAYPKIKRHPEWVGSPYLSVYYYLLNTTKPPLDNPKLRRAISLVLDRKVLTEKILQVGYDPAYSLVPPGVADYQSTYQLEENTKKAKELLKEAGISPSELRPLTILYNTRERHKQVAQVIAHQIETTLGLKIKLENAEWKTYLDRRRAKDYDIARAGWIGDYNNAYTFLDLCASNSDYNDSGWKNEQYDKWLVESQKIADPEKRKKLYQKAEALMLKEVPVLPIYFYISDRLVKPYVKNIYPKNQQHVKQGFFDILARDVFRDVWIDLAAKKRYFENQ